MEEEVYPKYNLGDLIEVVGTTNTALNGKIGIIQGLPSKEIPNVYTVMFYNDYNYLAAKHLVPHSKLAVHPKIKVGDKVRTLAFPKGVTGIVKKICDNGAVGVFVAEDNSTVYYAPSNLEVVQTKEQMEEACLHQWQSELEKLNTMELAKMQHPEKQYTYEAQLAHDIAVKLVGDDVRSPQEIGDYAAAVAKAVVEGLKKK